MKKEELINLPRTIQARNFAIELLKDGNIHTRKELGKYIRERGKAYGLNEFRESHIAAGIREASIFLGCAKPERGVYQHYRKNA